MIQQSMPFFQKIILIPFSILNMIAYIGLTVVFLWIGFGSFVYCTLIYYKKKLYFSDQILKAKRHSTVVSLQSWLVQSKAVMVKWRNKWQMTKINMFPEKDVLVVICAYVCTFLSFSLLFSCDFFMCVECVWSKQCHCIIVDFDFWFWFLLCFLPHLLGAHWSETEGGYSFFILAQLLSAVSMSNWGSRWLYLSRRGTAVQNPIFLLSKHCVNYKSSGIAYCGVR